LLYQAILDPLQGPLIASALKGIERLHIVDQPRIRVQMRLLVCKRERWIVDGESIDCFLYVLRGDASGC
jgi:hypothetical protein